MRVTSPVFVVAMLAATFALSSVSAQAQNVRVRGTIEKLDGNNLAVKSRDGAALKLVLKGVLISPHFLFLVEPPPDKEGPYQLGHYEIANHLSYFLWASMPDDELMQLAAAGKLHDQEVLRVQVRRMIRDPRARGMAESFAVQWLGISPLGMVVRPDSKLFPEFTDELAAVMREETVLFFDSIVRFILFSRRSIFGVRTFLSRGAPLLNASTGPFSNA